MTLNSHFALNTVFWVESFSTVDLVLRHDCLKLHADVNTVSGKDVAHGLRGFWRYMSLCQYSSGFVGEVVSNEIVPGMKCTGFTYRNLHGFARFRGDSTALVIYRLVSCDRA